MTIINVENLGKKYVIGHQGREKYNTLRDTISSGFKKVGSLFSRQNTEPNGEQTFEDFWALNDVSFDVGEGDSIGIIGRNGAGKSTLLKILSRITEPTTGKITIKGRVASLLEVGTGFHPELTGRENIFLNGVILGMSRTEVKKKFDEIVDYSEIEKFLDTPVKRYSSGMYVRLAFAVAAHLEPEILIVDEVLAVGDASFQKKCLGKMENVGKEGRTVLFVSHQMSSITRLCKKVILLDGGKIFKYGPADQVVKCYLNSGIGTSARRKWDDPAKAPGNEIVKLREARVILEDGSVTESADIRKSVGVEIEYEVFKDGQTLVPNFHFYNEEGICVFISIDQNTEWRHKARPIGKYISTAWIPGNFLAEGTFIVGIAISTLNPVIIHFYERDAVAFQIIDSLEGNSARGDYAGPMPGVVRPLLNWKTRLSEN